MGDKKMLISKNRTFEDIRQKTKGDVEFWSARDLQGVLGYSSWDKFKGLIQKAIKTCENAENPSSAHFSQLGKMVKIGLGVERHIADMDDLFEQNQQIGMGPL